LDRVRKSKECPNLRRRERLAWSGRQKTQTHAGGPNGTPNGWRKVEKKIPPTSQENKVRIARKVMTALRSFKG